MAGQVYPLIDMPSVALAVTAVDLESDFISGWLVADQQVGMTSALRLPSSAVEATAIEVPLKPLEKAALAAAAKAARLKTRAAMQCAAFRRRQRCLAIKRELLRGTRLALSKVRGSVTIDLGPYDVEFDEELLGIEFDSAKRVFRAKDGSLAALDSLLEERWDTASRENVTHFVTMVTLRLRDSRVTGSILSAVHHGMISAHNYRQVLLQHMVKSSESF